MYTWALLYALYKLACDAIAFPLHGRDKRGHDDMGVDLMVRSDAKHRVSNHEAATLILRDAGLRLAPQDEI